MKNHTKKIKSYLESCWESESLLKTFKKPQMSSLMLEISSLGMTWDRIMYILKSLADNSEVQSDLISTKKETSFIEV